MVFCNDVCSVTEAPGHQHDPTEEWRLFTDSSKVDSKGDLNLFFYIGGINSHLYPLTMPLI